MTTYDGQLLIDGDPSPPLSVVIDLSGEQMKLTAGNEEIAAWGLNEIRVNALPDGFHIKAEDEMLVLDVTDDARFDIDLGLQNAHPVLRRRMAVLLSEGKI